MNTIKIKNTINFGAYFLAFMLIEAFVNTRAVMVSDSSNVNYIYSIGLVFTALGYILYDYVANKSHINITFLFSIVAIISLLLFSFIDNFYIFLTSAYICLLSVGFLGCHMHKQLAIYIKDKHYIFQLSISMSIVIIIQYILQLVNNSNADIIVAALMLLVLSINQNTDVSVEIPKISDDTFHSHIKSALPYILLVCLMSFILGLEDSIVVYKNATGELSLFSYVRLFYALGLICAGLISEINNNAYLSLITICTMLLSVISVIFIGSESSFYNISMSIMYFYCGFYVLFLTVKFMEVSPAVAGYGRIVRSLATAVIVLITTIVGTRLTYTHCIIFSCIFIIAIILIATFMGVLVSPQERVIVENDLYPVFFEKYQFTAKEKEVFIKLVDSEDTVISIAADLGISRRVLQRHIASIYEKTGVQTRSGLIKCLYSFSKY